MVTRLRKEVNEDNSPPTVARAGNDAPVTVKGAGATFPFSIYQDWFKSFRNRHPAWSFEYAPVGSEEGIARLSSREIDFAGTDIPPASLSDRIPANSDSFPTVGGAVGRQRLQRERRSRRSDCADTLQSRVRGVHLRFQSSPEVRLSPQPGRPICLSRSPEHYGGHELAGG